METLNNINKENEKQIETTNRLLLDMVHNQKISTQNLVKTFITTIICYTIILVTMIVGFFIYESQFEVIESGYETMSQEQESNSDNGGDAIGIINNNGDWSYGNSKASGNDN